MSFVVNCIIGFDYSWLPALSCILPPPESCRRKVQLLSSTLQAADAQATISDLKTQLAAAREELAQQCAATDDIAADLRREAQVCLFVCARQSSNMQHIR